MSLGEAFIDVRFRTTGAKADLSRQLKAILQDVTIPVVTEAKGATASAAPAKQAAKAIADAQVSEAERATAEVDRLRQKQLEAYRAQTAAESKLDKARYDAEIRAEQILSNEQVAAAKASIPALEEAAAEAKRLHQESLNEVRASEKAKEALSHRLANAEIADIERVRAAAAEQSRTVAAPGVARPTTTTGTGDAAAAESANQAIVADDAATAEERAKLHRRVRDGDEQIEQARLRAAIEANARIIASDKALAAERAKLAAESVQFAPGNATGISTFQAESAKRAEAAAVAEAKVAAATQRDIAAQLQNSLALLRQRQAIEAKAAADAETAIAESAASREAAIAGELQNRLALLRQRQAAEAKAAYDAETVAAERAAVAQKASAAAARAGIGSGAIGGDFSKLSGIGGAIGGAAASAIGAIGTAAKFATLGVLALGGALVGIGLEAAIKVQNARVSFQALAANISATGATADEVSKKVDSLNASVGGLSDAERKSIGNDFTQQLINIANTSTLAQSALFDTSQQLLALGFNGQQTKDILLTFGNALAASGKSGGELNDDLKGVVVAISQIQGAGRLLAQDLNQITTRIPGISRSNVYKQIAADTKNLGDTSKVTAAQIDAVRKQLKAGGVDSAVATKAILEVTQKLPGFKGALERQNQTLSGQIDALKDNVRNALANLFSPAGGNGLTDKLAKQVGQFSNLITKALSDVAPKFEAFVTNFADTLIAVLPPLVTLSAKLFSIISDGLAAIGPKLPAIVSGFKSIGDFIGRLVTDLRPTLSILVSVSEALIALASPVVVGAISGIVGALEALNVVLGPIADALHPVVDAIQSFAGNTVVKTILEIVGAFLAFGGALTGIGALVAVAVTAIEGLTLAVTVLGVAILANPVGAAVAAIAALAVGFTLAWKSSQTFRTVVSDVLYGLAKIFEEQFSLMLLAIQKLLEGLATGAKFLGKFIPGIGGLGNAIGDAAKQVGNLRGELDGAVSSLKNLGDSGSGAGRGIAASAASIQAVNQALAGTGQQALSATATVDQLNAAVAALPLEKQIKILVDIGTSNTNFLNSKGIPLTGLEDATGFSTAGIQDAANKAQQSALAITDGFVNGLPTSSGGSGSGSAGAKVKSAAASAADTFKKAIQDILASLDKEFKSGLISDTVKQIDTTLDALTKKIRDTFLSAKKTPPSQLLKDIQTDNTKLKALAKERDKILATLKAAQDKFNSVVSSVESDSNIVTLAGALDTLGKAATNASADLSHLRIIKPGQDALGISKAAVSAAQANAQSIADTLSNQLKAIQTFQKNINALIAKGLNKETIDQIISAGVNGGGATAAALAQASGSTVAQINATQAAIDKAAKQLGNTAADSFFRSGKDVVSGLIAGLKEKRDEIKAAMKDIADALVAEIKKRLKIKSPSRVMAEEVGRHIIPGIVAGFDHGVLRDAMGGISETLAGTTLAAPKVADLQIAARQSALAELKAVIQPDGAWTRNDISRLHAGIEAIPGAPKLPGRVVTPTPALSSPAVMRPVAAQFATRRAR